LRVTAGELRGRVLRVPELPGLRPTPSKVRQALFNILTSVDDQRVLDLFSGTGIMALEALSRGAAEVVSVEQHRKLTSQMQTIGCDWGVDDRWQVVTATVEQGLKRLSGRPFDLVFADPPYRQGIAERIPAWLDEACISCAQLVVEEAAPIQPLWPAGWMCEQSRRYGDTVLHFLRKP